jgi:hypothetical protein
MQLASALPSRSALESAVEKLDMSSFRNSLADQIRSYGGRTLRQLGPQRFVWVKGTLEVWEADRSWVRSFRPLPTVRGKMRLCFTDHAQNGGTYRASGALELTALRNGLYRARSIRHRDC